MPVSAMKSTLAPPAKPWQHAGMTTDLAEAAVKPPEGFERGFTIEHILLSITVVHTNKIMQYDDSCAHLIRKHLEEYNGVVRVDANVLYNHTKVDAHQKGCECGICQPTQSKDNP